MLQENYKTKVEFGVALSLYWWGFSLFIRRRQLASKEMFGPSAMPFALAVSTVLGGILSKQSVSWQVGAVQDGYGFLESDLKRIVCINTQSSY